MTASPARMSRDALQPRDFVSVGRDLLFEPVAFRAGGRRRPGWGRDRRGCRAILGAAVFERLLSFVELSFERLDGVLQRIALVFEEAEDFAVLLDDDERRVERIAIVRGFGLLQGGLACRNLRIELRGDFVQPDKLNGEVGNPVGVVGAGLARFFRAGIAWRRWAFLSRKAAPPETVEEIAVPRLEVFPRPLDFRGQFGDAALGGRSESFAHLSRSA